MQFRVRRILGAEELARLPALRAQNLLTKFRLVAGPFGVVGVVGDFPPTVAIAKIGVAVSLSAAC